jgi:hypothetical protein
MKKSSQKSQKSNATHEVRYIDPVLTVQDRLNRIHHSINLIIAAAAAGDRDDELGVSKEGLFAAILKEAQDVEHEQWWLSQLPEAIMAAEAPTTDQREATTRGGAR